MTNPTEFLSRTGFRAVTSTVNANLTGPVTSVGNATSISADVNLPGSPTTTTQAPLDNSTKIATTAYVDAASGGATDLDGLSDCITDYFNYNVFLGENCGNITVAGESNFGAGVFALLNLTTGSSNIGVGVSSQVSLVDGNCNVSMGEVSLGANISGSNSTGIGHRALRNSAADNNTGVGYFAGNAVGAGSGNTLIGASADVNDPARINATALGYQAITMGDNTVQLGNTDVVDVWCGDGTAIIHADGSALINLPTSGTVTSVDVSGGTTGLTTSGGPVTTTGTITLGGLLDPTYGGTGVNNGANTLTIGASASVSGSNTGDQTITLTGDVTGAGVGSFAATIKNDVSLAGNPTATTQAPGDNSTKLATTAYADNAAISVGGKEACKYASIAALPSIVYANGASGVGATLTGVALAAISLDSSSPSVNDRVLIKNQASTFQNGIYKVTATGSGIAVFVLTRATDFDQSTDIRTGQAVFITGGSTLGATTWDVNSDDSPTMGTDAITFVQSAGPGSFVGGNGITITGNSIAIDTAITVDKTTAQTLTNKTLTSPVLTTPDLGTPSALVATNATGTASGLTAGNVTTNANLTGVITSVGNATSIASQTGTGTKFVVDTSPTLVTPNIGVATGTSLAASGVMSVGANSGTNGQITFNGSTSGSVAVKAAAAAGTGTVFQLPADNGTNTYVLQTNGSGVTSWVPTSGGVTPAALTKANDTNVTLTLGGTPGTALLQAASITAGWTGTLAEIRGGTAQSTYATGDILYASAANTLSKLAKNTSATRYLANTGASNIPAWDQVNLTNGVTGILPFANGGLGLIANDVATGAGYTILAADLGKIVVFSETTTARTFAFTAAATLGANWYCYVQNKSTGQAQLTLDPNASELIDGLTSYIMYPGEVRLIWCTGTAFTSVVVQGFKIVFTATTTFKVPPGYKEFDAEIISGGSAGASRATTGSAGGGWGGVYFRTSIPASALVAAGSTETVTVAGVAAGVSGNTDGTAGNSSAFTINGTALTINGAQGGANKAASTATNATTDTFGGWSVWLAAGTSGSGSAPTNQYFQCGNGTADAASASAVYGARGGGVTAANVAFNGGASILGGGGGGGVSTSGSSGATAGGASYTAGAGGASGSQAGGTATAGSSPGGGGGAGVQGITSGGGARGEVRISGRN